MKNQNASAEYPHIPAKGSLQTVLPMAALRSWIRRNVPFQWENLDRDSRMVKEMEQ